MCLSLMIVGKNGHDAGNAAYYKKLAGLAASNIFAYKNDELEARSPCDRIRIWIYLCA